MPQVHDGMIYAIVAYALTAAVLTIYGVTLARRLARTRRELAEVEEDGRV